MAAPSMKERQACWGARDLYWRCLDDNAEDTARCQKLRSSFEASCPQQWDFYSALEEGLASRFMQQEPCMRGETFLQDEAATIVERGFEIKYFDKRRDYLKFKEKFEAGEFQSSPSTENS